MQGISQSWAGRGDATLSAGEWIRKLRSLPQADVKIPLAEVLLRGSYPEIASDSSGIPDQVYRGREFPFIY